MPGFNNLVRFRQFEKCKIQNFLGEHASGPTLDEVRALGARSANKLLFRTPQT